MPYESPGFAMIPIGTMCSKTGCPNVVSPVRGASIENLKDIVKLVPNLGKDLSKRANDKRTVVFSPATQKVLEANETGAAILEATNGKRTVQEVAEVVAKKFGANPKEVLADTCAYLQALDKKGFDIKFHKKPVGRR